MKDWRSLAENGQVAIPRSWYATGKGFQTVPGFRGCLRCIPAECIGAGTSSAAILRCSHFNVALLDRFPWGDCPNVLGA